jgi:hypothetical protein
MALLTTVAKVTRKETPNWIWKGLRLRVRLASCRKDGESPLVGVSGLVVAKTVRKLDDISAPNSMPIPVKPVLPPPR